MKAYLEIEMPTSCGNCLFRRLWPEDDEVECIIEKTLWTKYAEKNAACPLLPVPERGRLIDADAFLSSLAHNLGIRSLDYLTQQELAIVSWVKAAPTIIPADGKGTNVTTREEGER